MSGSREAKLLTELAETQDQRSSLLATNYDLRKERDRLTDELAEARGLLRSARFAVAIAITYSVKDAAKAHYRKLLADIDATLPATADQPTGGEE